MSDSKTPHIHRPQAFTGRGFGFCPNCQWKRRIVAHFFEWYGPQFDCCGCGDSWGEEGIMERPFARGWRQKAIDKNRAAWDACLQTIRQALSALLRSIRENAENLEALGEEE